MTLSINAYNVYVIIICILLLLLETFYMRFLSYYKFYGTVAVPQLVFATHVFDDQFLFVLKVLFMLVLLYTDTVYGLCSEWSV